MALGIKQLVILFLFISTLSAISQGIEFQNAPEDFQLHARDKSDSAMVSVLGKLDEGLKYDMVSLHVFKDNLPYNIQKCSLGENAFSAYTKIDAGLHEFRFELHLKNGTKDSIVLVADSVVCGDAYIITGQSNSHASSIYSDYSSEYCRSFGVKTGYEAYNDEDKKVRWGRATGNCEGLKQGGGWFMKNNTFYKSITYLPNKWYLNTEDVYNGPWIFGENKIDALSFDSKKIELPEHVGVRPQWKGYELLDSTLNGVSFKIVFPKKANENRDWIWRARFWGHEPQTDIALLEQGFHLVYINVAGLFGSPKATKIWDDFYAFVRRSYQLNKKVVLEGMSRGGLMIFNWANENADKVACIYGDNPVCDFKSWPGGKYSSEGSKKAWEECLSEYGFSEQEALEAKVNPIDHMENVAKEQIPVLCLIGDADKVVPFAENTALLQARLQKLGSDLTIIHKPESGHHPHSLKDPEPIVDFILMHTGNKEKQVAALPGWSMNNVTLRSDFRNSKLQFEQNRTGHVAFIGGSITEMDGYRPMICNYLEEQYPSTEFNFTDAGIASTGSTTGAFRMERDVLSRGPLDLLFVEFAVNDDQDADNSYEEAILGMEAIIRKARNHNPHVDIVITYFVNPNILEDYQNGKIRTSIAAHEAVATHYNISTCNLAKEVADQISVGTLDWKTFGGTHPSPYGNRICANMITSMLEKAWTTKTVFQNPQKTVNPLNFENGRLINPRDCDFDEKWSYGVPDWTKLEGQKRERFTSLDMLHTTKSGAELTYEFIGTAIGAYVVSGPDAGIIEVSIDGGEYQEFDLYHHFSKNLHYPQTIMFSTGLDKGRHTLKLRMLKKTSSKGNAMRIMNFVVN